MKKAGKIVCALILVLLLTVFGSVAVAVLCLRAMLTQEVSGSTSEAVAFIRNDPILHDQWKSMGLDRGRGRMSEVVAAKAMLQAGARFYAVVEYTTEERNELEQLFSANSDRDYTLDDPVLGVRVSGRRYDFVTNERDGPFCYALVVSTESSRIHYYGYAGDG